MNETETEGKPCHWSCGRITKNHTGICDECWSAAEILRSPTDEGHKAWVEQWQAKEAAKAAKPKPPRTAKQQAALKRWNERKRQQMDGQKSDSRPSKAQGEVNP